MSVHWYTKLVKDIHAEASGAVVPTTLAPAHPSAKLGLSGVSAEEDGALPKDAVVSSRYKFWLSFEMSSWFLSIELWWPSRVEAC